MEILLKMTILLRIIFLFALVSRPFLTIWGQTATIKIERHFFENSFEKFDSIYFEINGIKFRGSDTSIQHIKLHDNLDKCMAVIGKDTLYFLTKFLNQHEYVIRPGCCCAAFTMQAKQNANRGTVTYKNKLGKDVGLVVCEHNSETVKTDSEKTIFASESAMCLYKPCSIQMVETSYFSDNYNYKNDERSYKELWKEQEKLELGRVWFHFLHGEKMEVIFDKKFKKIELKLAGYLTEAEIGKQ